MSRYYPASTRVKNVLVVYGKSRCCNNLNYTIKLSKPTANFNPSDDQDVILEVEKSHDHDLAMHENYESTRRVLGTDRKKIAKNVLANHGGSAKAYVETEIGKEQPDSEQPPSEDVIRRCIMVILFIRFFIEKS